ncbi:DnaJ subfamily C member 27 [Ilyodon furcidens]|uniref:DnaJ subfamily C member 27 n=1 Tax=Ilyodon furcidens TaxID=33524 RepID=A0ABV0UDS9_9TELE
METTATKRRDNKKSLRVKVISLGNAEVGKSCIIKRYCEKRFVPKYLATIGIDYGVTKVQVRDREIKVNIFDMAGHPFFYEVRNEFYKDSQGVLLVYDVGLRESFDALDSWLGEMKQEMGSQANMDSIVFIVCANKVDLTKRRVVDEGEGRLWAESRGFHYFETSAQSGEGINEMFQAFFSSITDMCENGGKRPVSEVSVGFTKEQADTIRRIRNSKDSWDMLGVKPGATREEVNKAYRKLAVLLHPDKCVAPGSEDAFKAVEEHLEEHLVDHLEEHLEDHLVDHLVEHLEDHLVEHLEDHLVDHLEEHLVDHLEEHLVDHQEEHLVDHLEEHLVDHLEEHLVDHQESLRTKQSPDIISEHRCFAPFYWRNTSIMTQESPDPRPGMAPPLTRRWWGHLGEGTPAAFSGRALRTKARPGHLPTDVVFPHQDL